jgi:hypothetical protein
MGRNLPEGSREIGGRKQKTCRKKIVGCRHSRQEPQTEKGKIAMTAIEESRPAGRGFTRRISGPPLAAAATLATFPGRKAGREQCPKRDGIGADHVAQGEGTTKNTKHTKDKKANKAALRR